MQEQAIVKASISKQIAEQLRAAIVDGRFKIGERLPTEDELAQRYGVSRPSVREALKRLAAQNLVRARRGPTGGNFVIKPSFNEKAIFAGGCFWGVEYYFQNETGVISTQVGYTGGHTKNPTYQDVLSHKSGHYEAIEITYDANKTDYETLAKLFFEIHDPTQANGQGNDIGQQYESVVFYLNDSQKAIANKLIKRLKGKGFKVATKLIPATIFWDAENYHQEYYEKGGGTPYCHKRVKRF